MNKKKSSTLVMSILVTGIIFSGCSSPAKKEEADQKKIEKSQEEVAEAQRDLQTAKQEADATVQQVNADDKITKENEAWVAFRAESIAKIHNNEVRITELRDKMKSSGKTMDKMYAKKIDKLEERNNELRKEIEQYQEKPSNWESFKAEWNHDMDELGNAFKDLVTDNKK